MSDKLVHSRTHASRAIRFIQRAWNVPIGVRRGIDISQMKAAHRRSSEREGGTVVPRGESGELLEHGKQKKQGLSRALRGSKDQYRSWPCTCIRFYKIARDRALRKVEDAPQVLCAQRSESFVTCRSSWSPDRYLAAAVNCGCGNTRQSYGNIRLF